jgi:hypothetical protein
MACVLLLVTSAASRAVACGISGPNGVWSCSLEEHDEETRPRWTLGAAAGYTRTSLRFGEGLRAGQTRNAVVAAGAYALTQRVSLRASAGLAFGGELRAPDGTHTFSPGLTAAVGVDYRLLSGKPFLLLSALLSGTSARTHLGADSARYSAFDLRLGAAFGLTLFDSLSPYALARVFGGPVLWRYAGQAQTGTDVYHYQLGLGLAWLIAERLNVSIEGVPLGERALSGQVAVVF